MTGEQARLVEAVKKESRWRRADWTSEIVYEVPERLYDRILTALTPASRADEQAKPVTCPRRKGVKIDVIDLLQEQHEAMSIIMMFRRLSSSQKQRREAENAINVWRKVDKFLKARAALGQRDAK